MLQLRLIFNYLYKSFSFVIMSSRYMSSKLNKTPNYLNSCLNVVGGRENNLKNINISIPHYKLVLFTGVSGCGKSSLLYDIIYSGANCRYLGLRESSSHFFNTFKQPDVDELSGLQAVIGIKQERAKNYTRRSTVGTTTDIAALLRLLFARIGDAYSHISQERMVEQTEEELESLIREKFDGKKISIISPLIRGRKGSYKELFIRLYREGFRQVIVNGKCIIIRVGMQLDRYKQHEISVVVGKVTIDSKAEDTLTTLLKKGLELGSGTILIEFEQNGIIKSIYLSKHLMDPTSGLAYESVSPNSFSFNSAQGACRGCKGLGVVSVIDSEALIPDYNLSFSQGAIPFLEKEKLLLKELGIQLRKNGYNPRAKLNELPKGFLNQLLYGNSIIPKTVEEIDSGIVYFLLQTRKKHELEESLIKKDCCLKCDGLRLKKEALHFKIDKKNIAELSMMTFTELLEWFDGLENRISNKQCIIAKDLLSEIRSRILLLIKIGLGYLTLYRQLKTLSGGEVQRLRLATQLGVELTGIMYVLDEPSIGLHQRDNHRLIETLKRLRDLGNSVFVIEHDKDTILSADYIIEVGPKAGENGGEIISTGTPEVFLKGKSITADYLNGNRVIKIPKKRRIGNGSYLTIEGCSGNNLKDLNLKLPLGTFITITGVSGSGKSTLINKTLLPVLYEKLQYIRKRPLAYKNITGQSLLDKVVEIDQNPIGRTPRSNPATYTGLFSDIREIFKNLPESKVRGYKVGRFSFNVKVGRCETCGGAGMKLVEMNFLPSVRIACESCKGKRYNRETLDIHYRGKSIADLLDMTVDDGIDFFENYPKIANNLQALVDVGLGYITLGQHSTTLSGGEAQRVKLASELAKRSTGKTLYVLDEPTTGLHFDDIKKLIKVLQKLVDQGNTVIVIEHNLDVVKVSDHIVDLGPEGGEKGGALLAQGTPEEVAKSKTSHTARFLKEELEMGVYT